MFFDFKAHWNWLDWAVVAVYFVAIICVGVAMKRQASKSFKSFFVAGRQLTIPVMVGVAAASWYDSWTIVGLGECGWTMGISIVAIYIIPCTVLRIPLALWIGPRTRTMIPEYVVTLPDLFRYFYARSTGLLASIGPLSEILFCCALLFAVGQVIFLISPMSMWLSMVVAGIIVILYTSLAGLWGLAVTDIVQFMIMTVGAGVVVIGILINNGGLEGLWTSIAAIDPVLLTLKGHNSAADIIGWVLCAAALYVSAQSYQRFGSAKTGGDIIVAYNLVLIIGMFFSCAMVLTGMAAFVMYPSATSPAEGFWAVIFTVLPMGLRGLFVVALIAAVMSTISANMLISSGILAKDIIKEFFKPSMDDQAVIKATRYMVWILGIFVIAGTYLWRDGIGNAWNLIGGGESAVYLIPLLAGFFYKNKKPMVGTITIFLNIAFYAVWVALGFPYAIPSSVATWVFGGIVFFGLSAFWPENKNKTLNAS